MVVADVSSNERTIYSIEGEEKELGFLGEKRDQHSTKKEIVQRDKLGKQRKKKKNEKEKKNIFLCVISLSNKYT